MKVAGFALVLFLAGFACHWLLWRIRVPQRQIFGLLLVLLGLLPVGLLCAAWLPGAQEFAPQGFWEHLHVTLFYVAVSLGYAITYSALEQDSPSLALLTFVADAGAQGRSHEELYSAIDDKSFFGARLDAMVNSRLIVSEGGVYQLTTLGRSWALVFHVVRRLLGLSKGG